MLLMIKNHLNDTCFYELLKCYFRVYSIGNLFNAKFPKIPLPKTTKVFIELMKLGSQLRMLHLMEDSTLKTISQYPESGNNVIEKHVYKDGNVYINDEQYFTKVPEVVWKFYIGGYQPAQKWLKDRKGQALQFEDIKHYQKIIAALQRTSEIMEEIDQIDFIN